MKNRKHKSSHQRKSSPLPDDQQHEFGPPQQLRPPSSHNKTFNNHPIAASPLQLPADKRLRNKKALHSQHRGCHSEHLRHPPTSKNNKKHQGLHLNLQLNQHQQTAPEESCRQYLMLDSYFVPLSAHTQKQIMAQFFSQTLSTSSDISSCKENHKRKILLDQSSRIRKISLRQSQGPTSQCAQTLKQDKATSSNLVRKHTQEIQVTVQPQLTEIATQYSERKQYISCQITQPQLKQHLQTLPQLLSKIQNTVLSDENHLRDLSSNDKQHFSTLLQSLISRLKPSLKSKIKPILFQPLSPSSSAQLQPYCQAAPKKQEGLGEQVTLFDRMEEAINYRFCHQMSWIHQNNQLDKQTMVDTSLFSVINFLCDLFCFIQIEYAEQFVENIRRMYGLSYREKYKRSVRDRPRNQTQLEVVGRQLFQLFFQQNQGDFNELQQYHCRAILDSLNEGLQRYRPYFLGNGQQFPWSLKLFVTMSEYSIDEDSLQIIFRQSKDKLIDQLASLCGILVEFPEEQVRRVPADSPIERRRKEAEDKMVERWLEEVDFERDDVEVENTRVMHRVAEMIYFELMGEAVGEMG